MVKKKNGGKRAGNQAKGKKRKKKKRTRIGRIGPNTPYGTCREHLSPFGGLLALEKMLDLIEFRQVFDRIYICPKRKPKLGHFRMVMGLLLLLMVGFQRLAHLAHLRDDPIFCGLLRVERLPVVSTFWRYVRSLGIVQSQSLLRLMAKLRSNIWERMGYRPQRISIDIDTTVATVYGKTEGARKGYNPKHRGKKGLRPVLCFIHETREYLCGKQRRGQTISRKEVARQILDFHLYLPQCVKKVLIRADEEFIGWKSVEACFSRGYSFIFASSGCKLPLPEEGWYRKGDCEYNECWYQPKGWEKPCRFVVMRKRREKPEDGQLYLLEEKNYIYRAFVTNLLKKPHLVVFEYDKRADVENLIGEAQREGILAIPSKRFQTNHAFFQIVMLAYNLWRWMKHLAGQHLRQEAIQKTGKAPDRIEVVDQTIRLARLKMLYMAAKVATHANRPKILYSIHDTRSDQTIKFIEFLDQKRAEPPPPRAGPRVA